jgi:hypothetical protein
LCNELLETLRLRPVALASLLMVATRVGVGGGELIVSISSYYYFKLVWAIWRKLVIEKASINARRLSQLDAVH